jgi:pyruvate formate lyase activating enzyme
MGRDVTVREVLKEVIKDEPYYHRSGGGVTLSGGESLLQPAFATALLRACRERGINTAIETTGFQKFEIIREYLPLLDFVLMDIKHMNSAKHKEFTTQPNELILENARKIAESGANLTIRVPVIPGFNDTPEEISAIAAFAASLPNVRHLHLLPYHRMGEDKYAGLGRDYALAGVLPMNADHMAPLLRAAEKSGLICQIGG